MGLVLAAVDRPDKLLLPELHGRYGGDRNDADALNAGGERETSSHIVVDEPMADSLHWQTAGREHENHHQRPAGEGGGVGD